jgi:hypothetical protein
VNINKKSKGICKDIIKKKTPSKITADMDGPGMAAYSKRQ